MTTWLRQSFSSVTVAIGPFVDDTDGKTPETALNITQPDIQLSKAGGSFAQKNASQTLSHLGNGFYGVTLDSTDTNTVGPLVISINESGALPVWKEYMVIPPAVYRSIVDGTLSLNTNVAQWGSVDVATTNPITESVIEGSHTIKNVLRIILAVLAGKASGLATSTVSFRDVADSKDRLVATCDADGNRTAITTRDGT